MTQGWMEQLPHLKTNKIINNKKMSDQHSRAMLLPSMFTSG